MLISASGMHAQYFALDGAPGELRARIRGTPWLPREQLLEQQLAALNATLARARASVPFYAGRVPERPLKSFSELGELPILTRSEVARDPDAFISTQTDRESLIALSTGGTTGAPLTIHCTPDALARHYAQFARFREWIGIPDRSRVAVFGSRGIWLGAAGGPPHCRRDTIDDALLCSAHGIDGDTLGAYVLSLVDFGPDVIDAFPSAIIPIARFLRAHSVPGIRPKAIVTSGDPLLPGARRLLEEAFSCPVFDHYGATEMVASITECRAGSYHVATDYGYVEVIRNGRPAVPGEAGEIVATGFVNEAMPLIRYATGDVAVAGSTHCPCGRTFPTIERLLGRADEALVAPDGHIIAGLEPVLKSASSLLETRIVQDAADHVTVEAVASGVMDPVEAASMMNDLRERLGPSVRADLVRVARIPRRPSGRFRAVQGLTSNTPAYGWIRAQVQEPVGV